MTYHVDVSVVIGFKDWGLERLALSIRSIQNSFAAGVSGEVIVSDYGSIDPQAILDTIQPLGALCVRTETAGEWSRSRALNAGIRAASGRHVFTTDADMLFTPNTFPALSSWLDSHPGNAAVLQCRDLPFEYSHDAVARTGFVWTEFEVRSKLRPRWGMGGLFGVHRSLIDAIGGYDERMHTYGGEDLDFAQRIRRSGVPITWIEDRRVRMYHVWHPSTHEAIKRQAGGSEAVSHNQKILKEDKSWVRNVIGGSTKTDSSPLVSFLTVLDDDYEKGVEEAVDSVLAQTVHRVESIVVARRRTAISLAHIGRLSAVKLIEVDDELPDRDLYAAGMQALSGQWTAFQPPSGVSIADRAEVLLSHLRGGQVGAWSGVGLIDVENRQGQRLLPCDPSEATSRSWNDGVGAASLLLRTDILHRLVQPVGGRILLCDMGRLLAGAGLQMMQAQRALVGVWSRDTDEVDEAAIGARQSQSAMIMNWTGLESREDEMFPLAPKDLLSLAPTDAVVRSGVIAVPVGLDARSLAASFEGTTRVWMETPEDGTFGSSTIRVTGMSRRDVNRAMFLDAEFQPAVIWSSQESQDTVSRLDPTNEIIGSLLQGLGGRGLTGQVAVAVSTDRGSLNGIEELMLPGGRLSRIVTDRTDLYIIVQPVPADRGTCADFWDELVRRRDDASSSVHLVRSYTASEQRRGLGTAVESFSSSEEGIAR